MTRRPSRSLLFYLNIGDRVAGWAGFPHGSDNRQMLRLFVNAFAATLLVVCLLVVFFFLPV